MYSGGYTSQNDNLWEEIHEERRQAADTRLVLRVNKSRRDGMTFIDCPFNEKNDAAKMGASWDPDVKSWYIPSRLSVHPFYKKWKISCRYCNTRLQCGHVKDGEPCKYLKEGLCCGGLCYDPVKAPKFTKSVNERILQRGGVAKKIEPPS
jgi:hypothetical protein